MKKNNKVVDIVVVLDRSGSMWGIQTEMVGAFNNFIEEQKKLSGRARVTLVIFDDQIDVLWDKIDINEVPELKIEDVTPRGLTALNDAIGTSINNVKNDNVVLLIQTDGYENTSKEYDTHKIKEIINEKKKDGWDISFLGADIDGFSEGGAKYNLDANKCFSFKKNTKGTEEFTRYVNQTSTSYRSSFNDKE